MATTKGTVAGFKIVEWSKIDDNGRFFGTGASAPNAGNTAGASFGRLKGAVTFPVTAPEDEILDVPGDDDDSLAAFNFPSGQSGRGTLELSFEDMNFDAYIQGLSIRSDGDITGLAGQARDRVTNNVGMLLQRRAIDNAGVVRWQYLYALNASVTPLGNDFTSRDRNNFSYSIVLTKSNRMPFGTTYSEANEGTTASGVYYGYTPNPLKHAIYTGDNAVVTFDLPVTPVGDSPTESAIVTVDDVLQDVTTDYTIDATASTITFASAPASSARIVVIYQIDDSLLGS